MKVAFVIPSLGCGGAERLVTSMAHYWVKRGWNISVLTFSPESEEPFFRLDSAISFRRLGLAGNSSNVITAAWRNLWRVIRLRRAIRSELPDVVISCMDRTNVYAVISTYGLGMPLIISEHSVPDIQNPGRIWNLLRRLVYPWADCLVVQSPEVREYFRPWFKKLSPIIPNAVEPDKSTDRNNLVPDANVSRQQESQRRPRIVAAAGRLSGEKGFDLLIRAFALVSQDHPDVSLCIWGDGPLRGDLERLRDSLGLTGRIRFPGNISPLGPSLLAAEMFVLSSRYEGFGNVLLEAMALGLPVVSFDCPFGPRQIIRDGVDGLLVNNGDIEAMARAINLLLEDGKMRNCLGLRAKDVAERFGLSRVMPLWENAILAVSNREVRVAARSGMGRKRARIRCFFLTRRLDIGGAERQLIELVRGLPGKGITPIVATFYDGGSLAAELRRIKGVRQISLHKSGRWDVLPFLSKLLQVMCRISPDIVHGYLMASNVLVVLMRPFLRIRPAVVWSYRTSNTNFETYDRLGRFVLFAEEKLSRFADAVIANSAAGRADAIRRGFPPEKIRVVRNGIDTNRFRPDPELGRDLRSKWGIEAAEPLIGLVARLDPIKRHRLFLLAAAEYCKKNDSGQFLCCGDGPADYAAELRAFARSLGIEERMIWSGPREDVAAVYNALDICTLCSDRAEGYPNVIGEAMACGTPCVTTDCGDAAAILGDLGRVMPDDPALIAAAWTECLTKRRDGVGLQLRARIISLFSTEHLITQTLDVLGALKPDIVKSGYLSEIEPLRKPANL